MDNKHPAALLLGTALLLAVTGVAFAQIDGPPPPDGPMQGLLHHGRAADRLLREFDTNHDGKITHAEFNNVLGARFAAATHGAKQMTADQFMAMHQADFAKHTAEMFRRADWNGDGRLTLEEFAAPQRAHFEMMDQEGTGTVYCNPLSNAGLRYGGSPAEDRRSRDDSDRRTGRGFGGFGRARFCGDADLSRDGKVTRVEFDTIVAKEFAHASGGAATLSLAQFSTDQATRYRDVNAKIFKRLDSDGDGKLTLAEFAAPPEKLFDRLDRNHDGVITSDEMRPQFRGRYGQKGERGNRNRSGSQHRD
ncbi:MAG TPA: EF-hand domain-containing protein [Rhizomicrobium sp.]|jgi:Ca2+-binding EF-hand superfamily protein|nr:EF-hand domain-containing protein [Rhizomicrobium sp.]